MYLIYLVYRSSLQTRKTSGRVYCSPPPPTPETTPFHGWQLPWLKGQCHEIFLHQVFLMNHLPKAPEKDQFKFFWKLAEAAYTLKWTGRKKIIYRLTLLPKWVRKLFWLKLFQLSMTPVVLPRGTVTLICITNEVWLHLSEEHDWGEELCCTFPRGTSFQVHSPK